MKHSRQRDQQGQGPEVGPGPLCWRDSVQASVPRAERSRGEEWRGSTVSGGLGVSVRTLAFALSEAGSPCTALGRSGTYWSVFKQSLWLQCWEQMEGGHTEVRGRDQVEASAII